MSDIEAAAEKDPFTEKESDIAACKDVCLAFSLSHFLHQRFLGLSNVVDELSKEEEFGGMHSFVEEDFGQAFKVVETELALMYDVLDTSNAFLYYYEARSASIWAFASVIGICFIGAVAVVPVGARTTTTRHDPSPTGTILVDTTTVNFVITGLILVCVALLQVLQLLRCWTSDWARVAFACEYVWRSKLRKKAHRTVVVNGKIKGEGSWGRRLRSSLIKINWLDKDKYLWQNKIGQHSLIESISVPWHYHCRQLFGRFLVVRIIRKCWGFLVDRIIGICWAVLGLHYISLLLQETLHGSNTGGNAVELHPDVKASIGGFVASGNIRGCEVSGWASPIVENGQSGSMFPEFLPWDAFRYSRDQSEEGMSYSRDQLIKEEIYVPCILMWHIATCYCELAQKHDDNKNKEDSSMEIIQCTDNSVRETEVAVKKNHRVAMALSKYCAYLVASAPRLLPGGYHAKKMVYPEVREEAIWSQIKSPAADKLQAMEKYERFFHVNPYGSVIFESSRDLGKALQTKLSAADRWELLAEFWVKALVYAAPSDNMEEHMRHLSQGGELLTHLWAMLYHAGIHKWQLNPPPLSLVKMGWDFIFRIRSWSDLEHHKGNKQATPLVNEGRPSEVRTLRTDASSSCPPPSP